MLASGATSYWLFTFVGSQRHKLQEIQYVPEEELELESEDDLEDLGDELAVSSDQADSNPDGDEGVAAESDDDAAPEHRSLRHLQHTEPGAAFFCLHMQIQLAGAPSINIL